jgi:hypothetical protein
VRRPAVFAALVVVVALLVALLGARMSADAGGVWMGAMIGGAFQLISFAAMVWLLPGRPMLAFGLGMLGRFALVALVALLWLPVSGSAPAPTLFALVSVLFATSLLEPLYLAAETRNLEGR